MKISPNELTRPDKLLIKGIKSLSSFGHNLYTNQKTQAKAKAELTFIGEKKVDKVESQIYEYDFESYDHNDNPKDFDYLTKVHAEKKLWLNFHGLHEVSLIEQVGKILNLDRLMIRHILDTTQRPKVEVDEDHLFLSIKSILKDQEGELDVEHISFLLGKNYLISFQEEKGDHFSNIRNKITEGIGFVRKRTIDYLLVQLLDAILDNYFETIDVINHETFILEKIILKNPQEKTTLALEGHKRSVQVIKKTLGPFKEVLLNILNEQNRLIKKENIRYFKDLVNTVSSAIDEIDNTQKTLEGLTNIYFASLSQKMNEIMKVLTTVATIFIPLTFIAGIYGMNFENMPELHYKYGYFVIWGIMLFLTLLMIIYFKRKKWI